MKRKFKFGYNAQGQYVGPLKKRRRPACKPSLATRCLRDGTLDVNLTTGQVYSMARSGKPRRLKTRLDEDGYEKFTLTRKASGRGSAPQLVREPDF